MGTYSPNPCNMAFMPAKHSSIYRFDSSICRFDFAICYSCRASNSTRILAISSLCYACNAAIASWCLSSDWASWSISEFSNSVIRWAVSLDDEPVKHGRLAPLLSVGVGPKPTPCTRPQRSLPITWANASSVDHKIPAWRSPYSEPPLFKISFILSCFHTRPKSHIICYKHFTHKIQNI